MKTGLERAYHTSIPYTLPSIPALNFARLVG